MRPLPSLMISALFLAGLTFSTAARAVIVYDPYAYGQLVAQVNQMAQQYQQQLQ